MLPAHKHYIRYEISEMSAVLFGLNSITLTEDVRAEAQHGTANGMPPAGPRPEVDLSLARFPVSKKV